MSYQMIRVIPLWFGQIRGNMDASQHTVLSETLTWAEKYQLESNLLAIRGSCDALIKQLQEAKETT